MTQADPKPVTLENITQPQLLALAIAHIHRFTNLIAGSKWSKDVRVDECQRYLAIWRGTYKKASRPEYVKTVLSRDERNEIVDALECGDYDALMERASHPEYVQLNIEMLKSK